MALKWTKKAKIWPKMAIFPGWQIWSRDQSGQITLKNFFHAFQPKRRKKFFLTKYMSLWRVTYMVMWPYMSLSGVTYMGFGQSAPIALKIFFWVFGTKISKKIFLTKYMSLWPIYVTLASDISKYIEWHIWGIYVTSMLYIEISLVYGHMIYILHCGK